jgi:hypothetical protein
VPPIPVHIGVHVIADVIETILTETDVEARDHLLADGIFPVDLMESETEEEQ